MLSKSDAKNLTISEILGKFQNKSEILSILPLALETANITSLEEKGPFTVFAPTDLAFNNLIQDLGYKTADELLARNDLGTILLNHVVSGKVMSSDLGTTLKDNNSILEILEKYNINVSTADIDASNGIVHVIDKVTLEPLSCLKENIVGCTYGDRCCKGLECHANICMPAPPPSSPTVSGDQSQDFDCTTILKGPCRAYSGEELRTILIIIADRFIMIVTRGGKRELVVL
jgi:hypothetical protein